MLTAIDFNDQFLLAAYEIDNIRTNRLLAHKLEATKCPRTQSIPELLLGVGGVAPQFTRKLSFREFGAAHCGESPSP